jgi:hypothetical protein
MIAAIRMMMFAIVPNFASCQLAIIIICDMITAGTAIIHQKSLLRRIATAVKTNNEAAISQTSPACLEMF